MNACTKTATVALYDPPAEAFTVACAEHADHLSHHDTRKAEILPPGAHGPCCHLDGQACCAVKS